MADSSCVSRALSYYVIVAWIWAIIWYLGLDPIKWAMMWILNEDGWRNKAAFQQEKKVGGRTTHTPSTCFSVFMCVLLL